MDDLKTLVFQAGLMPTLFGEDPSAMERVVRAVEQTEIPVVEILQRGEAAQDCLREALRLKTTARIGAGTVCSLEQCKRMVGLGADFIVSPGYRADIVDWCVGQGVPVVPGVSSPTEAMLAAEAGVELAKLFPFNELGGETYLNGIAGPFPQMKFVISGCLDDRDLHHLSNHKIAGVTAVYFFQGEDDHTVLPEEAILHRIRRSIEIGRHYRSGWPET